MGEERIAWLGRFAISFAVGFVFIRLLGPTWASLYSFEFPDSSSYRAVAALTPFSGDFWVAERPPTYPLLIWLLAGSSPAIVVVQTALSFAAWIWLIRVLMRIVNNRWVAYPAVLMLLLVALQARWIFWNTLILTESLSATLAVAAIAAWLSWWRDPSPGRSYAIAGLVVAWMLLRDSNAVSWMTIAAPAAILAVVLARRRESVRRRGVALILAISVVAGVYSTAAQVATDRGETSFHNNVGLRWLPDAGMTQFMVDRGMPLDDALRGRTGRSAWDDGEAFLVAPDLANYREWARTRGRSAAVESFVLKAPWYISRYRDEAPVWTDPGSSFVYDEYGVNRRFPRDELGPLDPVHSFGSMVVWAGLGLAGIAEIWITRRNLALILGLLWLSVAADTYLAFSGDAVEVGRHLTGPWLRFAVLSIVIVAVAIDTWWSTRGRAKTPPPAAIAPADEEVDA